MTDTYVYAFADAAEVPRKLLGGKGAGLADMTQLGLPVPDGFTITTAACVHAMHSGGDWPSGLAEQIDAAARRARGALRPPARGCARARCSCPSAAGAAVSMPGMMETILNLGLNDEAARRWPRRQAIRASPTTPTGACCRCSARSWPASAIARLRARAHAAQGRAGREARHRAHGRRSARALHRVQAPLPGGLRRRSSRRIRASSCGWRSRRCSAPGERRAHTSTGARTTSPTSSARPPTSARWCSATAARARAPASASPAIPSTGEHVLYGEFLQNAQGEDVVAGIRTPEPIERMRELLPRPTTSSWPRSSASSSTTARCRTSSSRSSRAASTCCRRAPPSARRRPRCASCGSSWPRA